jgi:hypothetical protein
VQGMLNNTFNKSCLTRYTLSRCSNLNRPRTDERMFQYRRDKPSRSDGLHDIIYYEQSYEYYLSQLEGAILLRVLVDACIVR